MTELFPRFSQDIQVADRDFPFAFLNFATNVNGLVGIFVFFALATPLLGLAFPFVALSGGFILRFYLATSKVCALA